MRSSVFRGLFFSLALVSGALLAVLPGVARGHVGSGGNCAGCHGVARDAQNIINYTNLTAVNPRLDPGGTTSPLKTFVVTAGDTVALQTSVTDGSDAFDVALTGTEKGGVKNSQSNHLAFTADPTWTKITSKTPNYFVASANEIDWTTVPHPNTYTFNMKVSASTPEDFYSLFLKATGVGAGDMWSEAEEFYVNVKAPVPEPSTLAMLLGLPAIFVGGWCWRRRGR
jgi:hypothetical protein